MISWRDEDDRLQQGSLFAAFAALARGEAWSFPALRPHQSSPFHSFVSQAAALSLLNTGGDALPIDESVWRDLLLALTPDHPTAWDLVVEDWSKPALLQPPVVADTNRADYKNRLPTPDALDMLVTAKVHDLKPERMAEASDEDWLFALVTLQTTEGFLGAGNYGISRMNGGFASRMSLGIRPEGGPSATFRRDVTRLVADARARPDRRTGTPLLWTEPWDGTVSLEYEKLDELYIEICRRVRLRRTPNGEIEALAAGSKCARVAAAALKGVTKDPWVPVKADGSTSHTPTGAGFGYRQMSNLLDATKITPPLLAKLHPDDDRQKLSIVAAALVRGQGKTEGLHHRRVRTTNMALIEDEYEPMERIGEVAQRRAKDAGDAASRLRRALISLVQGGPEQARLDDDAAAAKIVPWMRRFDRLVNADFFDKPFWHEAANQPGNPALEWRQSLRGHARTVFEEATKEAPRTEVRRIWAIARARTVLEGQMTKWLKEVE